MKKFASEIKGESKMVCKGCFKCRLWGELAALTLGIALVFATSILMLT